MESSKENLRPEGGFRNAAEREVGARNQLVFENCADTWEKKMDCFPKYVRRQALTRFLAQYELFKKIINVKGSIVECGVFRGSGLMSWAKFSAILEPVNLTRRIYGFDSFEGFPALSGHDLKSLGQNIQQGDLYANSYDELTDLINIYDSDRFLGHVDKVHLIKGDANQTIPQFVIDNPHVLISLLFLDFDLYEPTCTAIEHLYPRVPRGGIIAFDELDNPLWPGETTAMLERIGAGNLRIQRFDFDPYIGFAIKD